MKKIFSSNQSLTQLVELGTKELSCSSDSGRLDSRVLLCHVLNKELSYLLTWPEKKLTLSQFEQFQHLIHQRLEGMPIAYLIGEKEFWSLPFEVSESTLIPRPDTETLVELVLEITNVEDRLNSPIKLLDLGTGTGAIALSLAHERPHWQIEAVDINAKAVALAKRNSNRLNLAQVNIYQSDWFSEIDDKTYDFIISNPPYIDANDPHLSEGDVRFEPLSALVAQDKGLADLQYIADKARPFLSDKGCLLLEHGFEQADSVRNILVDLGYIDIKTQRDLSGNSRITWAYYSH